ncbi:MAG: hypothetical protein AB7G25_04720 [Sphingomonadaceae bacterium]
MGHIESKTFKSGNSVAVRLPKAVAFAPDTRVAIERSGDVLTIRRLLSDEEEEARLARFQSALAALKAIGPIGEAGERERIEFPERPGL